MPAASSVIRDSAAERVITIDVCTEWWSTRLYLLAFLLERFTSVRRVLIVQNDELIGLLSLGQIIRTVAAMHVELRRFEASVRARKPEPDIIREAEALIDRFKAAFTPAALARVAQRAHQRSVQRLSYLSFVPVGIGGRFAVDHLRRPEAYGEVPVADSKIPLGLVGAQTRPRIGQLSRSTI